MSVLDEFKNYKRKFIQISHRTAILMHKNFFNNDNISKSKNSYTVSFFYTYYDKNLFKRYHELKQDITKYYNLLQEYKTTYDNFILGLENESNSNQ